MKISIDIDDTGILTLMQRLADLDQSLPPVLQAIGDDIVDRARQRFVTSTAPDGTPWEINSEVTFLLWMRDWGAGNFGGDGRVNAKGAARLANKKPLIGETGDLAREFNVEVSGDTVTITNTMAYASIQQFGGITAPNSMIPGATIPARPFLPVTPEGELYPEEEMLILDLLEKRIDWEINHG
ncbi:MAG: phage virion morphogenesis protein [Methylobacillus sp.]|jgi:phage gpG-like protein|nr:phage virion morphogenesis protein [Methylobacillus sp.]